MSRATGKRGGLRQVLAALCVFALVASGWPARAEVSYPPVVPGTALQFPADEGAHPDYRLEWWYVTGWVTDASGSPRGFQVTFFRVRTGLGEDNPSRFAPRQVIFAHAALADPRHGKLRRAERSARAGFGLAETALGRADVRLDDWSLRQVDTGRYETVVKGEDFSFALQFAAPGPPLLQGERGYSRKGPDPRAASYYFSLPQLTVSGEVVVDGVRQRVTGRAWFDHEWSSDYVDVEAQGWDWLGINLADGGALMVFRMRDRQGGQRWASATLRSADGSVRVFGPEAVAWTPGRRWKSPRTGVSYPVEWRVRVGERSFEVQPLMDDAELDSRGSTGTIYWEGPVTLLEDGVREAGRGYLELTGYASRLDL